MRVDENAEFRGQTRLFDAKLNDGCVEDKHIPAGTMLDADKLEHEHRCRYSNESATTAVSEARVVHVVRGATGKAVSFVAGVVVACVGDSTITVDLKKNGATILTGVITLDVGDAAYAIVAGTIDSEGLVVDDVLEIVIVATVGTGTLGKGVFAELQVHEKAS